MGRKEMEKIGIACPRCGHKMGSLANFCHKCGSSTPSTGTEEERQQMSAMCGSKGHSDQVSRHDALFCAFCGTNLRPPPG